MMLAFNINVTNEHNTAGKTKKAIRWVALRVTVTLPCMRGEGVAGHAYALCYPQRMSADEDRSGDAHPSCSQRAAT
jgi:hypothetical protein